MSKKANKTIKIRVTGPLWGKFNLPWEIGHSPTLDYKLGMEIINSGHAITEEEAKKLDALKLEESNNEDLENEE